MNKKMIPLIGVLAAAVIGVVLVTSNSDDTNTTTSNNTVATQTVTQEIPFNLSFNNLAPLAEGAYEGWIVRGDEKLSFGTFNTTESGAIDGTLDFDSITPVNGDKVVVTIEPTPDTDPEPSGVVVLAGDIANNQAQLAFPVDLAALSGKYITGTPTNDPEELENSGIWFVIPGNPNQPSLTIPDAPDGWTYEGWVVYEGTPYSTGKFKTASERDSFDGYSGTAKTGPNYPGEDFVRDLPDGSDYFDLANGSTNVVVSIEPDINGSDPTGAGPAQVKPLSALISANIVDHVPTDLALSTDAPSGSFSL